MGAQLGLQCAVHVYPVRIFSRSEKTLRRATHITLEPLNFIACLAALIPKPRVNLTRFHGVFALNSRWRHQATPVRRRRGSNEYNTAAQRHVAMTWASV